ncbi:hypothetical protein B0H19DRAFT_1075989 [Mycena capillaripes]|nr:hypothetical protein B0H19DRAFT_1075989 [Mycena capillaripes]
MIVSVYKGMPTLTGCTPCPSHRFYGSRTTGNRPVASGFLEVFRRDGNGTAFRDDGRRNHGRRRSFTGDGFLHGKPTNFAYLEHFSYKGLVGRFAASHPLLCN